METLNNQSLVNQVVSHLQELQNGFKDLDFAAYSKKEPLLDMDVNKDEIIMSFDLNKDMDFTIVFGTYYSYGELVNIDIQSIESDSHKYGTNLIFGTDNDALILEGKRIIHDAEHYKLLDENNAIETSFYSEVYA